MRIAVSQNTERDAWIFAVNQINKIVYEFVAPAFSGLGFDGGFGKPVKENHYERDDEPAQARGMDHKNLQVQEVKVKEPVGVITPHRP